MISFLSGQIFLLESHKGQFIGVSQGLIYINNLSNNLSSNPKLFADDTSLFLVVSNQSGMMT